MDCLLTLLNKFNWISDLFEMEKYNNTFVEIIEVKYLCWHKIYSVAEKENLENFYYTAHENLYFLVTTDLP